MSESNDRSASDIHPRKVSRGAQWTGRAFSGTVVALMLADASVQLFAPGTLRAEMVATGFEPATTPVLGLISLVCVALYAVPRTAMLGAILLTGFLGGAICTHLRIGEIGTAPQLISVVLGALAWGGLYLRNPRLSSFFWRAYPATAGIQGRHQPAE